MKKCLDSHWGYKEDVSQLPCFRRSPDCFHGGVSMWRPLTNGDRVRMKTDEDLAAMLFAYSRSVSQNLQRIKEWLGEEAKDYER